jgi:membrane-associated phospholipid phosphatase
MNTYALIFFPVYVALFVAALVGVVWWDRRRRRTKYPFPENLKLLRMPGEYLWSQVIQRDEAEIQWFLGALVLPLVAGVSVLQLLAWSFPSSPTLVLVLSLTSFVVFLLLCVRFLQARLQRRADHSFVGTTMRVRPLIAASLLLLSNAVDVRASDAIQTAGDILQLLLPATAGGLTLAYGKSEGNGRVEDFLGRAEEKLGLGYRDTQGTVQFAESAGLTLGTTYILKYSVHEQRPNGSSESFPSAHTSISFCSAEFMRKRYGWEYGIPAYALASFVAYSRVEAGEHYPHDVLAGAVIGIASSYIFTRPYKGWHVQADVGDRYYGLRFSRRW